METVHPRFPSVPGISKKAIKVCMGVRFLGTGPFTGSTITEYELL